MVILKWKNQSLEQIWKVEYTSQVKVDTVVGNQQIQSYQREVSMDLTIPEDPNDIRDRQLDIGNRLVRGLQDWWGGVVEYLIFQPSRDKFCMNYINGNGIAYGYGCADSVS